jgi:hypothetical protein
MKKQFPIHVAGVLGLLLAAAGQLDLCGQSTAFSYQGRLSDGGAAANGSYDLRFALYSTNSGGSPVGAILTNSSVSVSNGLFTTLVDFGPVFDGGDYWLELGVRTNGSAGAFNTLSPRQPLSPVPYALYAQGAGNVSGVLAASNLPPTVALLNSSPNFAGSITATGFIGNGAGLTNIPNAALRVPPLTNGQSTAVNLAGTLSVGSTLTVDSGTVSNAFTLSPRNALPAFPVPVLRPVITNAVLAFDLMPNGSPNQYFNNGITWFDVCNADFLSGDGAISTARVGINTNWVYFGSVHYSGATVLPVVLGIDEAAYLTLNTSGNISIAQTLSIAGTNAANYAIVTNTLVTKGLFANVTKKTGAYTATANDFLIRCDTSAAGFTVTLPPAAGARGQLLNIKKISTDANTLTIKANGTEMIDGANTVTTTTPANYKLMSDGTGWNIL